MISEFKYLRRKLIEVKLLLKIIDLLNRTINLKVKILLWEIITGRQRHTHGPS